jgi:glutamyl-tRNA synthetase
MAEGARFYFEVPASYDEKAAAKFLNAEKREVLELLIKYLGESTDFTVEGVEGAFKTIMDESGLKLGKIGPTVRVALTGGTVSPGIYDVIAVLGKDSVMVRLQKALASLD